MYAGHTLPALFTGKSVNDKDDTCIKSQMQRRGFQIRKTIQLAQQTLIEVHGLHSDVSGMTNMMLAILTCFLYRGLGGMMMQGHADQH